MNKLVRVMTMGGFGLLAALATGTSAAQAAGTTGTSTTTASKAAASHAAQWRNGSDTVGYYRTLRNCELAGQFGERRGNWDDHDCTLVRIGLRRGAWALQVASDDDWNRGGFGVPFRNIHFFPGQFRPVWPGQFGGFPGFPRPGFPGGFPGQHGPGFPGGGFPGGGFPGQHGPGFPGGGFPGGPRGPQGPGGPGPQR